MANTSTGLSETRPTKVRSAPTDKIIPRVPTDAMVRAAQAARPSITINDPPLWLAIWEAMWDAAPD